MTAPALETTVLAPARDATSARPGPQLVGRLLALSATGLGAVRSQSDPRAVEVGRRPGVVS